MSKKAARDQVLVLQAVDAFFEPASAQLDIRVRLVIELGAGCRGDTLEPFEDLGNLPERV
jgi:hypothetical protein